MPRSATRRSSPTSSVIFPTASRKTTALIPNGALPLYSNHSAFPNSSLQTSSGSSFLALVHSSFHSFIRRFLHSLTRYHPLPRSSNSPPTHNQDTTDTQKSPSEPKIFDFFLRMSDIFSTFVPEFVKWGLCARLSRIRTTPTAVTSPPIPPPTDEQEMTERRPRHENPIRAIERPFRKVVSYETIVKKRLRQKPIDDIIQTIWNT